MNTWKLVIGGLLTSIFTNIYAEKFSQNIHNEINAEIIKANQQNFDDNLDQIKLWEATTDLPIGGDAEGLSKSSCLEHIDKIDELSQSYFYAIQLQKLAIDCHNLLAQSSQAAAHESHLLNLAQLVTESGDGTTFDSAFWITDIDSAYEFLDIAGLEVIDGELMLHKNNTFLAAYIRTDEIFGEYRYFQLNNFFTGINQNINDLLKDDEAHFFKVINMVLKSELKDNEGLFTLAFADITEAQILLAKLLLKKVKKFPTLYIDSLQFFEQASANGSIIAKYNYAYRIFIDKMEDKYTLGHELITAALSERYLPALTLAAIVREQKLGIKRDKKTIAEIISVLNEKGEPGEYELLIGRQMLNDRIWNNHKLAKKYLTKAIEKNNPEAMILYGDMHSLGYAVKQSDKKAYQWYQKASAIDKSGLALIKLGASLADGKGTDKNIKKATNKFITAGDLGAEAGYAFAGRLFYFSHFEQVDYNQAYKFFKKAHEQGDKSSTMNLAKSLFHGHGVVQDYKQAFELFESIQDEGYYDTDIYLASSYYNGLGTPKNTIKAVSGFRKIMKDNKSFNNNRKNIILANLNLRLSYSNLYEALTPDDLLIENLQDKVSLNDPAALFKLGYLTYMRYESDMTREMSIDLLTKAAELNVPYAYTQLANYYGYKKMAGQQKIHLDKAKDLGEPEALYDYATDLLEEQPDLAVLMLEEAAEKNLIYAINKLASIYTAGEIVKQDFSKALQFHHQALSLGDTSVLDEMADMYAQQQITQLQFGDTLKKMENAADESSSTYLMRNIAKFYAMKHLPEFNPEQTIHWYIKAFEAGDSEAIIELGKRYMYGIDLTQNFELAQFFFANAAAKTTFKWSDLVDEPGSFWVALMLQKGLGVEKNLELARQIYAKNFYSSRKKEAKNNYAIMTCQADNIDKKEQKKAFKLIKELSEKSRTVMFNLGWMYEHGICTKKDIQAAISEYQKSADKDSPHALYRLHQLYQEGDLFEPNEEMAADYLQSSLEASRKVTYHNMMSTFLDLPYIKNLQLTEPENVQVISQ